MIGDVLLGFSVPRRHVRGRVVRLGPVLDSILSAHDYPPVLAGLLAEALVLTALVGATLRPDEGQMTLQAQASGGPVDLLVCDYKGGELRGYLRLADADGAALLTRKSQLRDIFGEGYLAITLDQTLAAERYQGIVPLEGDRLCHAVEQYFASSEQIPTLIRSGFDLRGIRAGGLLLQYLPEGEIGRERLSVRDTDPDWRHVLALGETVKPDELTDPALPPEDLLWRLFHEEEVRTLPLVDLSKGCRCSPDYIADVLGRMAEEDRIDMRGDDGLVGVDCAFCARTFKIAI